MSHKKYCKLAKDSTDSLFIILILSRDSISLYAYKEQVVLGTIQESAAFLSPFLYGSSNGITIGKLHSFSNEYATGSAVIKNQMLYLLQNSIVADKIHYQKGKYYTRMVQGQMIEWLHQEPINLSTYLRKMEKPYPASLLTQFT